MATTPMSEAAEALPAADHLQQLVDTAPALLHTAQPDGGLDFFNQGWLDFLGARLDELQGWRWTAWIHPDDVTSLVDEWRTCLKTGDHLRIESRVRRADGQFRWFLHHKVPLRDETGRIIKWYGASIDIEDRKHAEEALRRSEAYLAEAQRLSHTGSFAWNVLSNQMFWSDEHFRIFEHDRTQIKPTLETVLERVHPADRKSLQETIERILKDQTGWDFEYRLLMPGGSIKHVHVVGNPLVNECGEIEFVGSVMDVTEAKRALREIQELKDHLYKENIALKEEIDQASMFEEIVGSSEPLRRVLAHVAKVAPTHSTVLITGETGTGKELVARAIHKRSPRSGRAFIRVNCGAIPQALIGSELFGHEKGAFTGAVQRRLGRFELADGGTLFLDEVGELPPETQVALLRVLQEREFERVGGCEPVTVDVRVLAATNRNLQDAVGDKTFREDLFYRLNVFPVHMPSLRERVDDIPLLVQYLAERYGLKAGKRIKSIEKRTLDLMQSYHWPGNIRELQNVIERAVILCDSEVLSVDETWLSREQPTPPTPSGPLVTSLLDQERQLIESALSECGGRVSGASGAAVKLGIPRSTLESRIRSLQIDKHQFRSH
ncbi:MAG TPA: sigma 54-interacting transcriptional regulator [Planctomycetaceae bacterium]|jgi:PAS domain S-box-containing protein|nr:sigma 54-interacting transcriptional regulator [Planctomycetaceae bacterium]